MFLRRVEEKMKRKITGLELEWSNVLFSDDMLPGDFADKPSVLMQCQNIKIHFVSLNTFHKFLKIYTLCPEDKKKYTEGIKYKIEHEIWYKSEFSHL